MFPLPDIADALEAGLRRREAALRCEQAVFGLDALDEVELHPLLAEALRKAGFGVHRERRYPGGRRRRENEGERCDLVITPEGRPLSEPAVQGTLFHAPNAAELEDALWLEVKVVAQHLPEGPNYDYSTSLLSTVRQDVTKLAKDEGILHAAILIILFVADLAVRDHDLRIWQDRCLERTLPITAPYLRELPIVNRLGNEWCTLALYGVRHL